MNKLLLSKYFSVLIAATCASPFMSDAKTLYVMGLTGQSNSLGVLWSTPNSMTEPKLGTQPSEKPGAINFWYDNFLPGNSSSTNTPFDTLMGASTVWGPVVAQPNGTANDPIYRGYGPVFWGPEVGMARCATAMEYKDWAIVKASRGGGGNSFWNKYNVDPHAYIKYMETVKKATQNLPAGYDTWKYAGQMYVQGESNSAAEASVADVRYKELVDNLKTDWNQSSASPKTVFGEIVVDNFPIRAATVLKQNSLVNADPKTYQFVSTAGAVLADNVHYNADAQVKMGCNMGKAFAKLAAFPNTVNFSQNKNNNRGNYGGFSFKFSDSGYEVKTNEAGFNSAVPVRINLISLRSGESLKNTTMFDPKTRLVIYSNASRTVKVATSDNTQTVSGTAMGGEDITFEFINNAFIANPALVYFADFETLDGRKTFARFQVSNQTVLNSTSLHWTNGAKLSPKYVPRVQFSGAIR